jgi:tetratricopeptide (TPR) repeat protein
LSLSPNDEFNHLLLGAVELEDQHPKAALTHFENGLAINPASSELLCWRGRTLHELGRLDAAEGAFLASLKIQPEDASTHFYLARLQTNRCRFHAAMPHIREFVRLMPDSEEGAALYWEIIKTQHPLLQAAVWLNEKCRILRRRALLWLVGTMAVGIPLVIALTPRESKEASTLGILVVALIATLPFLTDVLPGVTDALWLWLGRDHELPLQSRIERLTTIEIALGFTALPIAALLTAIDKTSNAFFWAWGGITIAVLHNLGMRAERRLLQALFYIAAVCFLIGMLRIAFLDGPPDDPNKWRMVYMVAGIVVSAAAGYIAHRMGQIK